MLLWANQRHTFSLLSLGRKKRSILFWFAFSQFWTLLSDLLLTLILNWVLPSPTMFRNGDKTVKAFVIEVTHQIMWAVQHPAVRTAMSGHECAWDGRGLPTTLLPSWSLDPTKIPQNQNLCDTKNSWEHSSRTSPMHLCLQAEPASLGAWAAAQRGRGEVPVHDKVTQ